jgi:hypothetical protein
MIKTIRRFSTSNKHDVTSLEALTCDNHWFKEGYGCPSEILKTVAPYEFKPTYVFVAITDHKEIAGAINIVEYKELQVWQLILSSSRAFLDSSFKGVGSAIMNYLIEDARSENIEFIIISGYSDSGLGLYIKFGFKFYGKHGNLVCPIQSPHSILHPNVFRRWNIIKLIHFNAYMASQNLKYKQKLPIRKSEDTYEYNKEFYGTPDYDMPSNSMVVSDDMIRQIQPFPDWAYKYSSKSIWPF